MMKKILFSLSVIFFFGLPSSCYAGSQTHATTIIPVGNQSRTTTITTRRTLPHAPAHGYRHHYNGHDLQYDSNFGAYRIIGSPGLYYYDNNYLRFHQNGWQISNSIGGVWHPAHQRHIPLRLQAHHARRPHANQHQKKELHENKHRAKKLNPRNVPHKNRMR